MMILCLLSLFLIQILSQCPPNQYFDEPSQACLSCQPPCVECSSQNDCDNCQNGYYLDDKTCLQCDKTCQTCDGPTYQHCLSCIEYLSRGTCIKIQNEENKSNIVQFDPIKLTVSRVQASINQVLQDFMKITVQINDKNKDLMWLALIFGNQIHQGDALIVVATDKTIDAWDGQINIQIVPSIIKDDILNGTNDVHVLDTYMNSSITIIKPFNTNDNDTQIKWGTSIDIQWAIGSGVLYNKYDLTQLQFNYHFEQRGTIKLGLDIPSQINLQCTDGCSHCNYGQCDICQSGYYNQEFKCFECDFSCDTCSGPSNQNCTSCASQYGVENYLVEGQCLNSQNLLELHQSKQSLDKLTPDEIIVYIAQFNRLYKSDADPYAICPTVNCLNGFCLNKGCKCLGGSVGVQCEINQKKLNVTENEFNMIANTVLNGNFDLDVQIKLIKYVSEVNYAMNQSLGKAYINKIKSLTEITDQISDTSLQLLFQSIVNLSPINWDYDIFNNALNNIRQALANKKQPISSECLYGKLYAGELQQSTISNIQALGRIQNISSNVIYQEVFNSSGLKPSPLIIRTRSQVISFDLKTASQDVNLTFKETPSIYANKTDKLHCVQQINSDYKVLEQANQQDDGTFECQVHGPGTFFVAEVQLDEISNRHKRSLWSLTNFGFLTCCVLEGITLLLFLIIYSYDKYFEKNTEDVYTDDEKSIEMQIFQKANQQKFFSSQLQSPVNEKQQEEENNNFIFSPIEQNNQIILDNNDNHQQLKNTLEIQCPLSVPRSDASADHQPADMDDEHQSLNVDRQLNIKAINQGYKDMDHIPEGKSDQQQILDQLRNQISESKFYYQNKLKEQIPTIKVNQSEVSQKVHEQNIDQKDDQISTQKKNQEEIQDKVVQEQPYQAEESEDEENFKHYDTWNIHPLIAIYRSVKYHMNINWQLHFLSLFLFTLHVYMIVLIIEYDIYVQAKGDTFDGSSFIGYTIINLIVSWAFNYLFGIIALNFREEQDTIQSLDLLESKESLKYMYWVFWALIIFFIDIIVCWRAFYFNQNIPDYWFISSLFSILLDLIFFDIVFIAGINFMIEKKPQLKLQLFKLVRFRGFFQIDLYERNL